MLIRVASVPNNHVYVRHLGVAGDEIERIADPIGRGVSSSAQARMMLTSRWVVEHSSRFDIFHFHFRSEQQSIIELYDWADALLTIGKPLVFTVHDLQNPQIVNQKEHRQRLNLLMESASELITLTMQAARDVHQIWGRDVSVVSHPHVVPLSTIVQGERRKANGLYVVGLHLKSMRPGILAGPVIQELEELVATSPDFRVRVDINRDGVSRLNASMDRLIGELLERPGFMVSIHDRFTDDELWQYLKSLNAAVLPYRTGTHSGWAEACFDLGTVVLAPSHTCISDQHSSFLAYELGTPGSLSTKLRDRPTTGPAYRRASYRAVQRLQISASHRHIYERVLRRSATKASTRSFT